VLTLGFSVAEDFHQKLKVRVNCSISNGVGKKVLVFDTFDDRVRALYINPYGVIIQPKSDFPGTKNQNLALFSHMRYVMKPIIHVADESLRELSPAE
jgi:hypothetical protein